MTLNDINNRIHQVEPLVTLYKGEGYLYYSFDNVAEGSRAIDPNPVYREGTSLVYATDSVMTPYLKHQPASTWIEDGIAFGRKVRAENGL